MNKKKLALAVVALAVVAGGYSLLRPAGDKAPKTPAIRIKVAEVARQDIPQRLVQVGSVVAYESVAVKARLDSQVVQVLFKDGDTVQEGQRLFELDDRSLLAQIKELEANLARDKAQLANSRLQYERAQKLLASKTVAQSRVDETRAAYQAQLAQVAATQANLDNARVMQSYTKIDAPISGRTGTINVTRGNTVRPGDAQPLVTINQVMPIRVQFSIPQRYYDDVRRAVAEGSLPVVATRSDSNIRSQGVVEYLNNAIDTSTGTFAARARFANEDESLWPGMFVNVVLETGTLSNVLAIPSVALQGSEGDYFVYVYDAAAGKVSRRSVDVQLIAEPFAAIASGLEEKEKVATDGLLRLTDGANVELAPDDAPKPAPAP